MESTIAKGATVRYIGTAKPENIGRVATVRRYIKSRTVYEIQWRDDGKLYDALPQSLTTEIN